MVADFLTLNKTSFTPLRILKFFTLLNVVCMDSLDLDLLGK